MADLCAYCGSPEIHAWQGRVAWCGSDACDQRHANATYEPNFRMPPNRTPMEMALAWVVAKWFHLLSYVAPCRWFIDRETGLRHGVAVWVWSSWSYWADRSGGLV